MATLPRSDYGRNDFGERRFEQIVGASANLEATLEKVVRVAPTDSTVLIEGETGTGKELIARAIHNLSPRCGHPLIKLNCAAIPTDLLESELFGHEKGAFTGALTQKPGRFEMADRGTLFLDEVGDLPPPLQPKLLRVLQEQEFERLGSGRTYRADVRVVAASNRNLGSMVARGQFRNDLYYRLNVFPIFVPPLRGRRGDIPALVDHFVQIFGRRMGKRISYIPSGTMAALQAYSWPGNVRELQNLIERAVILADDGVLPNPLPTVSEFPDELLLAEPSIPLPVDHHTGADPQPPLGPDDVVRIVKKTIDMLNTRQDVTDEYDRKQRDQIVNALAESRGRVGGPSGAAARIGINRTTLLWRMKKFGIHPKQFF